jgi:hypothetical protein
MGGLPFTMAMLRAAAVCPGGFGPIVVVVVDVVGSE